MLHEGIQVQFIDRHGLSDDEITQWLQIAHQHNFAIVNEDVEVGRHHKLLCSIGCCSVEALDLGEVGLEPFKELEDVFVFAALVLQLLNCCVEQGC